MPNQTTVSIGGNVEHSQIAVGNNNTLYTIHGNLVTYSNERPVFTRRPAPVSICPRNYPNLLDRASESESVKNTWASLPIVLKGDPGIGKTSLLHKLAYLPEVDAFPDGVIYLSVRGWKLDDLRQKIFESFYQSNINAKAEEIEILSLLQDIQAIILLDDVSLSEDEISILLDSIPRSAFVITSTEPVLLGKSELLELNGLPEADALILFERTLGRSFANGEKETAREICELLEYHPLHIIQFGTISRKDRTSLVSLKTQLEVEPSEDFLLRGSLELLPQSSLRILYLLAAANGVRIPRNRLKEILNENYTQPTLDDLKSRGLIQEDESKYSVIVPLIMPLTRTMGDLSEWENRITVYFVKWLSQNPKEDLIEEAYDILVLTIKKAAQKNDWKAVINLSRGLERFLILWRHWESWEEILNLVLKNYLKRCSGRVCETRA